MNVLVLITEEHPDGVVVDADAPHFSPLDQGIHRGDGIFESALLRGGRVRKLERHLWRLARSAGLVHMDIPGPEQWQTAVERAVEAWDGEASPDDFEGEALIKLMAMRGYGPENPEGHAWVQLTPLARSWRPDGPIRVSLLDRGFDSLAPQRGAWLLVGAKTLSYGINMAAVREAKSRGDDDVIFVTIDGVVLEAPTSTVIVKKGRTLHTTPTEVGVLPGTTQMALYDAAPAHGWDVQYTKLTPQDLFEADAVWLSSSGRLLSQVGWIDGKQLSLDNVAHAELSEILDQNT